MKTLLKINDPKDKKYIIWEHVMKSVFAFSGTFALMIFGPLLLEAKSKSRHHQNDSNLTVDVIMYLSENPHMAFIICGVVTLIYNILIFTKNSQKKYVSQIDESEGELFFVVTNLKFKGRIEKRININQLSYKIETKTDGDKDKTQKLKFFNKQSSEAIGEINPKHILWNKHIKDIRSALSNLSELGVEKNTSKSMSISPGKSFFK